MKYLFILLLILTGYASLGNDGSFYAMGNTLVPLKETTIQLKKEVLNLTRQQAGMQVDIYFEFFNPGEEKELLVGFVTPPAAGDVSEKEAAHPQIDGFAVMVNNNILPYKITRLDKSGFKLKSTFGDGEDFVYHFTVKFKKGTTVIRHSYQYRGGSSVEAYHDYYYRLTTGATWANGAIEDFELNINMGNDVVFTVPTSFNAKKAGWNVIGIGKINNTGRQGHMFNGAESDECAVFIRNGTLQLKEKHFVPTSDLGIVMPRLYVEYLYWNEQGTTNDFDALKEFFDKDTAQARIKHFSNEQLRLYRNLHYARKGYDFKDPVLKQTFSKYVWYVPDPNLKLEGFPEHYFNKEVQQLLEEEERRRNVKR